MSRFRLIYTLALILLSASLKAQEKIESNNPLVETVTETNAERIAETGEEDIPAELLELISHPLDLNNDDPEILIRYNLLEEIQFQSLIDYKKKMGNLIELEELQQVEGFDKKTILAILPYCSVQHEKSNPKTNQLLVRFQKSPGANMNYYPGSSLKILARLKTTITPSLQLSLTGEKDAGEEFFTKQKKGFDFNSFNLAYSGKSTIRKIIAGDYNIEFGQGLTAWTGLNFGSGTSITGIYKSGRGIVPYSGTDENRFFRGVAISLQKGKFRNESWISYHGIDGNKITDSTSNDVYISSIQTSGYHRTYSESADYHSEKETAFGTSVSYRSTNLSAGIVFSAVHYSLPIIKTGQPYRRFEFNGNSDFNTGINYSYSYKNFFFFGENAWNKNNTCAFLNGLLISVDPRVSLGVLWRSYATGFPGLKSNAFGVNTTNSNENGNYFGINFKISKAVNYSGYIDVFSFPFIKYRIDQPSHGFDFLQQVEITPTKKFTAQFRYRKKLKQQNDIAENSAFNRLSDHFFQTLRVSFRFKLDNSWEYACRSELSLEHAGTRKAGSGTAVSQDLFFHPMGKSYSLSLRYAIFNCPDFDTRIYSYENDVQGAFSIPFYYGTGNRFYSTVNLKLTRGLNVSLKYAVSIKEKTSEESTSSEIKIQLKYTFR